MKRKKGSHGQRDKTQRITERQDWRPGTGRPLTWSHCPAVMEVWCRSRIPVEGNFGQTYDSLNQSIHGLEGEFSATINLKVREGQCEVGGGREWEEEATAHRVRGRVGRGRRRGGWRGRGRGGERLRHWMMAGVGGGGVQPVGRGSQV